MAFALDTGITAFPSLHGSAPFAMELRKLFWDRKFAGVTVALPALLQESCIEAMAHLPVIHAVTARHPDGTRAYLPMDPCDAYVEAMRQATQKRIPLRFLEDTYLLNNPLDYHLPDAYLMQAIGLEKYTDLARSRIIPDADTGLRAEKIYRQLRRLSLESDGELLLVCDFPLFFALEKIFSKESVERIMTDARQDTNTEEEENDGETFEVRSFPIASGLLYFALGELPFYTGELEKERQNVLATPRAYLDLVKKIFVDTRNQYLEALQQRSISLKKLQIALTYARNLAALEGRLTPELLDLITAAKGVFGSGFATRVFEAARYYPFFDPAGVDEIRVGPDHIQEPDDEEPVAAVNLLQDHGKTWKTLHLKKEPSRKRQVDYRYAWDPRGMCSHLPEDIRIEAFNQTVRRRSRETLLQASSTPEKLTASLKDGIDLRETLRRVSTGGIYVKEEPPTRGRVDTVVIIFDEDRDERYPNRATWYAEHAEESTLTFYATDPMEKMLGPGIAEAEYGGLSLLFPPRPVTEVFSRRSKLDFHNLAEQLLYGALQNSREKVIAYVSARKPDLRKKKLASRWKKRLVWIPLSSFSQETLQKLRKFHILNGKQVRAWANRFIDD